MGYQFVDDEEGGHFEYVDDGGDTGSGGGGDTGSGGGGGGDPTDQGTSPSPGYVLDPATGYYKYTYDDGSTISVDANGNIVGSTNSTDTGSTGGIGKQISDLNSSLGKTVLDSLKGVFTKRVPKKDASGNPIPDQFEDETDWAKVAAAGGALLGASGVLKKPQQMTGYQGGIPTRTAVQQQVPGTYDPTRRPGSAGQRSFTDVIQSAPADVASAKTAVGEQATGLAALNAANPAMQKRSVAESQTAAPASSVINRMAPTLEGLAAIKNIKDSAPTDIMATVKAANPNLDWSKYNPDKMTMDYDEFSKARDDYMRAANPTFNQNKESDMAKAANAVQNAQLGGINPTTPANQTVAQPAAPGKYDSPANTNQDFNLAQGPYPYASGGGITALKRGNYLSGSTDGMADKLPANIDGNQEARLSHGEFVIPADVVSHLGNGNSEAGADRLYSMMDKIRKARTGTKQQGKQINPNKFLPGGSVGYSGGGDVKHFLAGGVTDPADPARIGTESNLSNWAGSYVTDMLGKGQALSNTPYQGYSGPLTAGASAGQTAAFDASAGLKIPTSQMGAFTPQTFTADQAQNYMNPYLSAALNPQMEEMRRQSQLNLQPNMAKLTQAGGYGGSRQALMNSEANRNLLQEQNKTLGQGYQTAFDKAMGQFNTEQKAGLDTQTANNAYGLQALQKQADLGAAQRDIEQQGITADKAQFEEERQDPFKKVQFQQSLLDKLPIQAQSNNYQQTSWLDDAFTAAGGANKFWEKVFSTTPASSTTTTTAPIVR